MRAALERVNGKWTAVVCDAIPASARPDDGTVTGVDMNVGHVAISDGRRTRIVHAPDNRRFARTQRRIAQRCRDWQHQVSRAVVGGTVVVEESRTRDDGIGEGRSALPTPVTRETDRRLAARVVNYST